MSAGAPAAARRRGPRLAPTLGMVAVVGLSGGWVLDRALSTFQYVDFDELDRGGSAELAASAPPLAATPVPAEVSDVPAYPGTQFASLAHDVVAQGLPMVIAFATTPDPPARVLAFYETALRVDGIDPIVRRFSDAAGYVSYTDPSRGVMHSVSVIGQGDHSLVFASVSRPDELEQPRADIPPTVPLPPSAIDPVAIRFTQLGQRHHAITATVPDGSLEGVTEFFRDAFTRDGWETQVRGTPSEQAQVEAHKHRQNANVVLRKSGPGAGISAFIMYLDGT